MGELGSTTAYQEIRLLVESEFATRNADRIVAAAAVHSAESQRRIAVALEALVAQKANQKLRLTDEGAIVEVPESVCNCPCGSDA